MVPALPDMPHDDTEFDLDVRLQEVARHTDELAQRATEVTCTECTGGKFSCSCD